MKKALTLFTALYSLTAFAQYPTQNVTLLSTWDSTQIPSESFYGIRYNGIWGWVDPQDNREYAIIGSTEGTHIIDVTNPSSPVQRDFVPGRRNQCIWREYKTYQNYLYAVSDDSPPNSLQIINLSYLPDSVSVVHDNNTILERSHTIFIDGNKLHCGIPRGGVIGGTGKMAVFDLTNPTAPTLLRKVETDYPGSDYVHDMYVRNDTVYASSSYAGLFIYKYNTTGNTYNLLASLTTYLDQGYNHSSALTADGNTLIFCDEVPVNMSVKALDVSNLSNLTVTDYFKSTPSTIATPHNPFIRAGDNTRVIIAYYQDGVQIFDISNPSNVVRTGFIDTNPTDCPSCPNPSYSGCWGAYVDLPSGIIIASDMQNGLFVIDASGALVSGGNNIAGTGNSVNIFPNPSSGSFQVTVDLRSEDELAYEIHDISGRLVASQKQFFAQGKTNFQVEAGLEAGVYFLTISGSSFTYTEKLVRQ